MQARARGPVPCFCAPCARAMVIVTIHKRAAAKLAAAGVMIAMRWRWIFAVCLVLCLVSVGVHATARCVVLCCAPLLLSPHAFCHSTCLCHAQPTCAASILRALPTAALVQPIVAMGTCLDNCCCRTEGVSLAAAFCCSCCCSIATALLHALCTISWQYQRLIRLFC
jgi:hypothetical protein